MLEAFAGEHGHTVVELALAWVLSHSAVGLALCGFDRPEHVAANVTATDWVLTPEERAGALKRGVRLDETIPGTGLGLSIVKELAELHRGSLDLGDSSMGGLQARLRFPKS